MADGEIGKYEGGDYKPNVHDSKVIAGRDPVTGKYAFASVDEEGRLVVRMMAVNPDTLEWEPVVSGSASPAAKYMIADMADASDPQYYGYVDAAGAWYIMRLTAATGEIRYAKGDSGYAAAWAAKAAQSYELPTIF